ncbi:hypothetical protein GCM10010168_52950 [Actinoplanes ianthinogenes]|uniref:Uncharacterized protein n=1 Tax=Actinoplanes ianthinogenes TaxID=122358 RepID=A0ABM7LQZ2_9ACTN|nr:hypothetical protein [Actinoplanes ianthinogenes]BCJ41707.1 hypothetical protein Aiant_23640 [Actinoplanes ianthinogenes]GGR28279.1 hypothetical protein GCM10010168_52950 [Actinoplanes ianthinogenes]
MTTAITPISLAPNHDGILIEPGPFVPSVGRCAWCDQLCTLDAKGDLWVSTETGRGICTPENRGAECRWASYRLHGIDPLTLSGHDFACLCQSGIMHHPLATSHYPHPDRVPFHCGKPARLTPTAWICRGSVELPTPRRGRRPASTVRIACDWTVPPGSSLSPECVAGLCGHQNHGGAL